MAGPKSLPAQEAARPAFCSEFNRPKFDSKKRQRTASFAENMRLGCLRLRFRLLILSCRYPCVRVRFVATAADKLSGTEGGARVPDCVYLMACKSDWHLLPDLTSQRQKWIFSFRWIDARAEIDAYVRKSAAATAAYSDALNNASDSAESLIDRQID